MNSVPLMLVGGLFVFRAICFWVSLSRQLATLLAAMLIILRGYATIAAGICSAVAKWQEMTSYMSRMRLSAIRGLKVDLFSSLCVCKAPPPTPPTPLNCL